MKKIVYLLAFLAILSSCKDLFSDIEKKDELIEVNLSLTGEVSVKEEPLTKAFDSNDLIAIQVYQNNGYYAYGLFDDISNLKLYLHSGRSYSIKAFMINNGKNTLRPFNKNTLSFSGYYTDHSLECFMVTTRSDWAFSYNHLKDGRSGIASIKPGSGIYYEVMDVTNEFSYTSWYRFDMPNKVFRPITDSYYGEFSVDNISGDDNSLSIEMKHLVYVIQCNVTGVTDGTASITIKKDNNVLLNKTDISGEYHSDDLTFSCSSIYDAWQYSDNYTENITVSMTWLRGVGVTQDLGSQVVQVKRNCKNVINVSLSTSLSSPAIIINQDE